MNKKEHPKPRNTDRHKNPDRRKGDRHKTPRPPRPSTPHKKKPKSWKPVFVALDGEGFERDDRQFYGLFAVNHQEPILMNRDIPLRSILDALTQGRKRPTGHALIGYGLGYDFEQMLKWVSIDQVPAMEAGEWIDAPGGYALKVIRDKILMIADHKPEILPDGKEERVKQWWVMDVLSFFQKSFVKALEEWGVAEDFPELMAIVREGKATRGRFTIEDADSVIRYNQAELDLMEALMDRLYNAFAAAFHELHLPFRPSSRSWHGPGAMASLFLEETQWEAEHPPWDVLPESPNADWSPAGDRIPRHLFHRNTTAAPTPDGMAWYTQTLDEYAAAHAIDPEIWHYPFARSFFGGRIEEAAAGLFFATQHPLIDGDIRSAYPYAISLLPKWGPDALRYHEGAWPADQVRPMGMVHVRWQFPKGWYWYPFPYRYKHNVFFPQSGEGWVMTPEWEAVIQNGGAPYVEECEFLYIDGTSHADGESPMPEEHLSTTAKVMARMAALRLELKDRHDPAAMALKLLMNSGYGKLTQQVGLHRFFNDFAMAWITSVCRAKVWRAIAPVADRPVVVAVKTDGILTLEPLPYITEHTGSALGDFEVTTWDQLIQCLPGIYEIQKGDEVVPHYRGFGGGFDFQQALRAMRGEGDYPYQIHTFVSRSLGRQWHRALTPRGRALEALKRKASRWMAWRMHEARMTWRGTHPFPENPIQSHLIYAVRFMGGIDPAKHNKDYDWSRLPRSIRKKGGTTFDQMAEDSRWPEFGWSFASGDDLAQALADAHGDDPRYDYGTFMVSQKRASEADPEYQSWLEAIDQEERAKRRKPELFEHPVIPFQWETIERTFSLNLKAKRDQPEEFLDSSYQMWTKPKASPPIALPSTPYPITFTKHDWDAPDRPMDEGGLEDAIEMQILASGFEVGTIDY